MDAWVWSLILLGIGIIIIGIEMIVPSGGVLGLLSALAILAAIALAFMSSVKFGLFMTILVALLMPAIFVLAVKYWPETPIGRLIMIQPPKGDDLLSETESRRNLKALIGRRGTARCAMLPGGVVEVDGVGYDAVSDGTAIDEGQPIRVVGAKLNYLEIRLDELPEPQSPTVSSTISASDSSAPHSGPPHSGSPSATGPPAMRTSQAEPAETSAQRPESVEDLLSRPIESLGLDPIDDPLH